MKSLGSILFISSNTTTGGAFFDKALRMGFDPVLICSDATRFPFTRDLEIKIASIDETDQDAVRSFALDFAWNHYVAGVMSTSDYFQVAAADVARLLGLPTTDAETLRLCRNKANQRRRLAEARINQPRFFLASTVEQAVEAFHKIAGQVVLKPVDGTGSVGVRLADDADEVQAIAAALLRRTTNERGLPIDGGMLVEEFIEGNEFSIEIFDGRVVGVTEKCLGKRPYFVETGHTYPAAVDDYGRCRLEQVAVDAVRALGLNFGPVHVEAKLADETAKIIEVNARLAGGFIPHLVELTGVDLISATIAAATGVQPLTPATAFPAAAIQFVIPPANGTIVGISGFDRTRTLPGVQDVRMYKRCGDLAQLHGDFRDRIGHVIAAGSSPEEAAANATAAIQHIGVALTDIEEKPYSD